MLEMSKDIWRFSEQVLAQEATIATLKDRVRELELGHGVLQACVIHIEVGGQKPSYDLCTDFCSSG
jgi:hypothetical protein